MKRRLIPLVVAILLSSSLSHAQIASEEQWPGWRGPLATGEGPRAHPPWKWDEQTNIAWKVAPPGRGHSTPIMFDERIFLTAAIPVGEALEPRYSKAPGAHDNLPITHRQQFVMLCYSLRDGKELWRTTVQEAVPHDGAHYTASLASASPVTDGRRVYASFGSAGVFCLDFDGKLVWRRKFPDMQVKHGHGEGSSPVLGADCLILNWDHEGQSFIVALDKLTGADKWRKDRDEVTSWATPIVVDFEGREQVIVSGTQRIRAYDVSSGDLIWECGGLSANVVASPVFGDGVVFAGSSYDTRALLAIPLRNARGDLTNGSHVLWSRRRATPYVPSPLYYKGSLYFLSHYQGVLSRVDARTGQEQGGPFRLDGVRNVYASPVAADGRVYITDRDGATLVLSADDEPQALALNRLNDTINASLAMTGNSLLIRGEKFLYCIRESPP